MLDSLIKNIGPEVFSTVTEKFGLNEEMGNKAVDTTKESLKESVTKEVSSGNLDGLLSLINSGGNATGDSTFQNMAGKLSGDYIQKLGLSPDIASKITSFVLPMILGKVSSMFGGNVDKEGLTKMLGSEGGLMGKAGDLLKGGLGNLFK